MSNSLNTPLQNGTTTKWILDPENKENQNDLMENLFWAPGQPNGLFIQNCTANNQNGLYNGRFFTMMGFLIT